MVKKKTLKKGKKKTEQEKQPFTVSFLSFQSELANKKYMRRGGNCLMTLHCFSKSSKEKK